MRAPRGCPASTGGAGAWRGPPHATGGSQHHAKLSARDGTWLLEDLGSTNGTFVNDHRVTAPVEVHAGDVVKIGKTVLELRR